MTKPKKKSPLKIAAIIAALACIFVIFAFIYKENLKKPVAKQLRTPIPEETEAK